MSAERVTAVEAVGRLRATDTLGIPLATGQPSGFIEALATREDWEDLRISGGLLTSWSEAFKQPHVHYLSGFYGPMERMLRDSGANISFSPADFRRFTPLLRALAPRVMGTMASPPDENGRCSLSLHAGATYEELKRAGADPERLLVVEASEAFPRTCGLPDEYPHSLSLDEIDLLVGSDKVPLELPDAEPDDVDRAIAEHARGYVHDGCTLQTGIGSIPSTIVKLLAEGEGGDYGIHSEMFTTGLMHLHQAGKVTNRKGIYDGVSVATFAMGTNELYDWLKANDDVAFLPVDRVNAPELIARNRNAVTINGAMSLDIHGQVVADTIHGAQFSGIGGHEDFVGGPGLDISDRSLLCLRSTAELKDGTISRIVPWFEAGTVITTPRHQVDVVVTEYGCAELQGKTVRGRGEALAAIAHPDFREELMEAAKRASGGRSPVV